MKNSGDIQAVFMRDTVPIRLGRLAAHLENIGKSLDKAGSDSAGYKLVRESMGFIEWIVPDVPLDLQVELVDLQRLLARWSRAWAEIQADESQRKAVAEQADEWTKRLRTAAATLRPAREVA